LSNNASSKKYNLIWCFGDSWGYGSELNFSAGEIPFAKIVANKLGTELRNLSVENLSLGLITREIALASDSFSKDDLVLVVIPPDSRWYTEWKTLGYNYDKIFFADKSDEWFEYHHQLFIFAICEMIDKKNCDYLLMHNYGKFPLDGSKYCFTNYHQDRFLDTKSLTELLTDSHASRISPIQVEINQSKAIFNGPYFEGCQWHPNELGHQYIADKITERLLR
jgi:hypothetical protein